MTSPRTHPAHHVPSVKSLDISTQVISRLPASKLKMADRIKYGALCRAKPRDCVYLAHERVATRANTVKEEAIM